MWARWQAQSEDLGISIAVSYCPDLLYLDAKVRAFWWASYACPTAIRGSIAFSARDDGWLVVDAMMAVGAALGARQGGSL